MTRSDLIAALTPVVEALDALGVRHYVGGSVASSVHGVQRASIDADVIADLDFEHVAGLVARLQDQYYLDEGRVRSAVVARRSFNAIHLASMFKVDVFAARRRPYDREALARARPEALDDAHDVRWFLVATAEDTVLAKLEWFRAGGEISQRQWADILGVLRSREQQLDREYLARWAAALEVADLLHRAADEAGL